MTSETQSATTEAEYAVNCASGVRHHDVMSGTPFSFHNPRTAEQYGYDLDLTPSDCSPHRLISRSVSPWMEV